MVALNSDETNMKPNDLLDIFKNFDTLVSNVELLDKQRIEARERLNKEWATEHHPYWVGINIVRRIIERTRKLEDQKTKLGRTQLLVKELKAQKPLLVRADPQLWERIERSLRLDEKGLMIDEDIFMTLDELKKRVESGEVIKALGYLNSPEGKGKFLELEKVGETELVNDVRKLLSDAKRIRYLLEKRVRVLDYYYGLISGMELNSSSLNNLIRTIRNMVSYFEQNYPNDRLLKVIKEKKILLHLMMYYIEIQYLEGLLLKVRKGIEEGGWQDFLDFYDQKTKLKKFNEHVRKIRDDFGDLNTAQVLENAGANTRIYGDQPLKWIKLLESLIYKLNSDWYITELVKVGHKSLSEVIKGEKNRIQDEVKHQLTKQLVKIEEKIAIRIRKMEDVGPIIKSILKDREKTLIEFLKTTQKEFYKREEQVSIIFEDNKEFLATLPQINVEQSYNAVKKSSEYKIASIPNLVGNLKGVMGSIQGIIKDPRNPYNFTPLYAVIQLLHYLYQLEGLEEKHYENLRVLIYENIPFRVRKGLSVLVQIGNLLEDSLSYLESKRFVKRKGQEIGEVSKKTEEIMVGGENYGRRG